MTRFICVTRSNFSPVTNFSHTLFSIEVILLSHSLSLCLCLCCTGSKHLSKQNQRQILILVQANTPTCIHIIQPGLREWESTLLCSVSRADAFHQIIMFCRCFLVVIYFADEERETLFVYTEKRSIRICTANIWLAFGWVGKILTLCLQKQQQNNHLY